MAARIRVLDESVINRIAAGEVVERPVSVVKELVENSIDAQAATIRVDIEAGGRKLIRVRDDGTGMSHDDAFLALERHTTSKLQTERDLVGIGTMGFRGEALASIAAVSKLRLVTNDGSDPAGTEIIIEGGVLRKAERVGMGRGALLEVRNLFFNVPVRRKFLKGAQVESGHIQEFVTKIALAFPSVGIVYAEDGKVKLETPAVNSTFERIHTMYSKEVRENLVEVNYSRGDARLRGYVARPPFARSDMRSVLTFVNGRSVRDRLVNSAVTRAFANLMERGRYPLAILFIEAPPDQVDVNVHPQKAEVRFVNTRGIFDLILDGVHEALTGAPFRPPPLPRESFSEKYVSIPARGFQYDATPEPPQSKVVGSPPMPVEPVVSEPFQLPDTILGAFSSLGILGSLPSSFLVLYNETELIIMDQHAAHERVLFDELICSEKEGRRIESQDLLIPKVLEYSPVEARALSAHLELLQNAGFGIEEFGDKEFVVKGVPTWLKESDVEAFFSELVTAMIDTGLRGDPHGMREELLRNVACAAAVKESKMMKPEEIRGLLRRLDRIGTAEVCPHGRPLTVRFPLNEIRKKMGRKPRS